MKYCTRHLANIIKVPVILLLPTHCRHPVLKKSNRDRFPENRYHWFFFCNQNGEISRCKTASLLKIIPFSSSSTPKNLRLSFLLMENKIKSHFISFSTFVRKHVAARAHEQILGPYARHLCMCLRVCASVCVRACACACL